MSAEHSAAALARAEGLIAIERWHEALAALAPAQASDGHRRRRALPGRAVPSRPAPVEGGQGRGRARPGALPRPSVAPPSARHRLSAGWLGCRRPASTRRSPCGSIPICALPARARPDAPRRQAHGRGRASRYGVARGEPADPMAHLSMAMVKEAQKGPAGGRGGLPRGAAHRARRPAAHARARADAPPHGTQAPGRRGRCLPGRGARQPDGTSGAPGPLAPRIADLRRRADRSSCSSSAASRRACTSTIPIEVAGVLGALLLCWAAG